MNSDPYISLVGDSAIADISIPSAIPSQVLPVGTVYEGDLPRPSPPTQSSSAVLTSQTGQAGEEGRRKREERKLAIMMMSKKRKHLFDQIMKSRRRRSKEVGELKRKRQEYEDNILEGTDTKRVKVK